MSRLNAKSGTGPMNPVTFSPVPVEVVAAVKLRPGFCAQHFHDAARGWFPNARHQTKFTGLFVNHPVMIITLAKLELRIVVVYARPDFHGFAKVKRCAVHRL